MAMIHMSITDLPRAPTATTSTVTAPPVTKPTTVPKVTTTAQLLQSLQRQLQRSSSTVAPKPPVAPASDKGYGERMPDMMLLELHTNNYTLIHTFHGPKHSLILGRTSARCWTD
jgi:hypothetical protein